MDTLEKRTEQESPKEGTPIMLSNKPEDNLSEDIKPKKSIKKKLAIVFGVVVLLVAITVAVIFILQANRYSNGVAAFTSGNYSQAVDIFSTFHEEYKDSKTYLAKAKLGVHYTTACQKAQTGEYDEAIAEYKLAEDFLDSQELLLNTFDQKGEFLFAQRKYEQAAEAFATAKNYNRRQDCGIQLVEDTQDYATALAIFENDTSTRVAPYRSYANAILCLDVKDYQGALDYFSECAGLLDTDSRQVEATFHLAEKCLHEGYLNKAKALYTALPQDYTNGSVAVADRIALLNKNQKFLDLVGNWSATDTYFKVQANSTTSSYYYYWYQDALRLGNVEVTCPYNDDGTFTIQGSATFPSYQNFSSYASELKTGMETFNFSTTCKGSIPYQIDSSSTTKLTFSGNQFNLQYKYVNQYSNVYWRYTFTCKATYASKSSLAGDR